jgi:DNA-binding winged helix-turn-helix (wHTH) protein/tetratricopeptide (TPR) repeat protein
MLGAKPSVDEIELDLGRYELRRRGQPVKLEKKPMELLIFLVARREQLVSRQDIVSKLWRSDLFIDTERNINNIVRKIRTALGDDSDHPRFIETVVGKGYRFTGPVRVIDARSTFGETAMAAYPVETQGERTSLAVLPLVLLGNATDDQGLCLGFADALVASLGNLQGVDVLPTSAVINVPPDTAASNLGSRLGVRFVVHGAIQLSKGQWSLSVQVFDAHLQSTCYARKRDFTLERLSEIENEIAKQIAVALNRPLAPGPALLRPRYSKDPMAYAEFMRGYHLSSSGDAALLDEAAQRLTNAITRDPNFSLAHAALSFVCATRHFEFDPASVWLEKAEFHCRRALELNPDLPEGHVARAFLIWGPSKNFQHLEAIAELKRALTLQKNLPHAHNRLGTILAHIGLLDHAREMYQRGRPFHPKRELSHSIVQVYVWSGELELAHDAIRAWRAESPSNKYALTFDAQLAMMTGRRDEATVLLNEALRLLPEDPLVISLQGAVLAQTGDHEGALDCMAQACANPKSFGHTHHTYYQIACILALTGRHKAGFDWLERSVSTGFACWPFFLRDPCLQNLRSLPEFEVLVSALQSKYPDHLGLL